MSKKIHTRTGDAGETGMFSGERVPKFHPLVAAYGTVDELNSLLGVVLSAKPAPAVRDILAPLQERLVELATDLATSPAKRGIKRMDDADIRAMEAVMDGISAVLPELRSFIPPSGTPAAAHLHVARTVARRAEREAFSAARSHCVNPGALAYLNRLSDLLFLLARYENFLRP